MGTKKKNRIFAGLVISVHLSMSIGDNACLCVYGVLSYAATWSSALLRYILYLLV